MKVRDWMELHNVRETKEFRHAYCNDPFLQNGIAAGMDPVDIILKMVEIRAALVEQLIELTMPARPPLSALKPPPGEP